MPHELEAHYTVNDVVDMHAMLDTIEAAEADAAERSQAESGRRR